ncbi:maltooligosyl trehalose hydrolase [Knoellia remsis]|uniref:1,4-alpha-glucan branching enzyme n=1 Tax=Knoellia remsis TaxID=407159 RepID=A0A2T0UGF5_9MICO|nr:alpha-amylase family glycosyl hydrolase [Knoellia remsis]PRY57030.1 maltooligosyl trehalose hydrolase [Knoellia remsis]
MDFTAPSPHAGMGAVPVDGGVTFRVWAPNSTHVWVTGSFNGWDSGNNPQLERDGDGSSGTWSAHVPGVTPGAEYRFQVDTGSEVLWRADPYARQMTSSVGNCVVYDPSSFDWGGVQFRMPSWDDVVIYELHVGTFGGDGAQRGSFESAAARLPHLRDLGVSVIQVMPPFEYAGDISWGYNPSHLFAVESGYGGPDAFKAFIKAAHEHGMAVVVDVVHNHIGPSDLDLWRFDGWYENDGGGIYFYNDWRADTPWGDTRPDYGRPEVRGFLRDSAALWLEEFRVDGLRFDATNYIRSVTGGTWDPGAALPGGADYLRWLTGDLHGRQPWKLIIAEDNQSDPTVTEPADEGGLGFDAQWDAGFVHPVRDALVQLSDEHRDMDAVGRALLGEGRGAAGSRIIYTESHDEVANGKTRLPEAVAPGDAGSWAAKKRAALGFVTVMCAPGIPMLFQGQEFLEDRWFDDSVALDWGKSERNAGIVALHRDLIRLRRNADGVSAGLRGAGSTLLRVDNTAKVIVLHRWDEGGANDDTVVVLNFSTAVLRDLPVGLPAPGRWAVRFNSDSPLYAPEFGGVDAFDVEASGPAMDGCDQSGAVTVGPYSAVVLTRT